MAKTASGLSSADEQVLQRIARQADAIEPCRAYLGGSERAQLDYIGREARNRLDPTFIGRLAQQAEQFFAPLERDQEWGRRALSEIRKEAP